MLLKRLTLACETTFWIVVTTSLGAPPLFQSMTAQSFSQLAAVPLAAPIHSATPTTAPQSGIEQGTLLEQLVAHYETYTELLEP